MVIACEVEPRKMTDEEKEELWHLDRLTPASRSRRALPSGGAVEFRLRKRTSPEFEDLREYAVRLVASGVAYAEVAAELTLSSMAIRKWVSRAKEAKEATPS